MLPDQPDSRGLNDRVDEKGIPAHFVKTSNQEREHALPFTIFVDRIFCSVIGRVPPHLTNRIPPRGIFLIAEHDNVLWDDTQPLACLFLNFFDTALVGGN